MREVGKGRERRKTNPLCSTILRPLLPPLFLLLIDEIPYGDFVSHASFYYFVETKSTWNELFPCFFVATSY